MSDGNNSSGIGVIGLLVVGLTILFVAFKLLGVVDWGWLYVLSPILLYIGATAVCCIIVVIIILILCIVFVAGTVLNEML